MAIIKYSEGSIGRVVRKEEVPQEVFEDQTITKKASDEEAKNEEEKHDVPSWAK